jgi:outer membrane protein TolC
MKRLIISLITLLSCASIMAQEAVSKDSSLVVSLDEAKQYAVEHNRTVQNAGLSVKQAEAARWQAIASMLPQVSGSLGYTNMCGYEMSLAGMPVPMNPTGELGIKATMTISGQQIVGSLISDLAKDMQDVAKAKTIQVIEANVTNVYVNLLATQETVELLRKNMVNLETLYKMTENAVKVGSAEQIDADQLSVQVATMESAINNTDRAIEVLKSSLQLLLGVDASTEVVLSNKLDDILNVDEAMKLLSSELVLEENYDYALSKQQAELAKRQVTMKAMEYVPSITGFYQYSGKTYFGEAEGMNMTPPNTVGVTVSVPIWSSGVRAAGVTEKKLAYQAAQNTLADTEDQLRVSDRQYRYDLVSAYDNYQIQKRNIEVTQRVFDNMSKKFEYGYASSLDVTNTSTNLITAQQNYIQALTSMVNAHINLKNLLNK